VPMLSTQYPDTHGKKAKRMPLSKKGRKIMSAMKSEYGEKKGKQVFHASKKKGTIRGVEMHNPHAPYMDVAKIAGQSTPYYGARGHMGKLND